MVFIRGDAFGAVPAAGCGTVQISALWRYHGAGACGYFCDLHSGRRGNRQYFYTDRFAAVSVFRNSRGCVFYGVYHRFGSRRDHISSSLSAEGNERGGAVRSGGNV